jgi:hypothetical protein
LQESWKLMKLYKKILCGLPMAVFLINAQYPNKFSHLRMSVLEK